MRMSLVNTLSSSNDATSILLLRLVRWATGLSLSSVIFLLIVSLTTIILRRKGYGIRLGLACLILYARPGSRRFPDGVQVRVTTRIVGFLFGGCRGPWLDVYSDRFYMRLRPTLSPVPGGRRPWLKLLRFLSIGFAAVDRGYWISLGRNILGRIVALVIRGLRVRVEKVRIWKDAGSWEYKAEQFVLFGHADGFFGSKYSISVNEFYVNFCKQSVEQFPSLHPIHANLVLRRGVELTAYLSSRFFTLLSPRRLAILDDLRVVLNVHDLSCSAPNVLDASVSNFSVAFCPGYSRGLREKLPLAAPPSRLPRRSSILRYWESTGELNRLALRLMVPSFAPQMSSEMSEVTQNSISLVVPPDDQRTSSDQFIEPPPSENGVFIRLESVRLEAYGKSADERHEAMAHASLSIRGCSAGSSAVDTLSHALYEAVPPSTTENGDHRQDKTTNTAETSENIDKIVAARPEALLWIEDLSIVFDMNCYKRHAMLAEVMGSGGVIALEPVGLVLLAKDIRSFTTRYLSRSPRRELSRDSFESDSVTSFVRTASSGSIQTPTEEGSSARVVSELSHWTFVVLGRGPIGDGDTMALVFSSEVISLPQIDFLENNLLRVVGSTTKFMYMHWGQWERTTNIHCQEASFDIQRGINDDKKITLKNMNVEWDLDAQSGLESIPELFSTLKRFRSESAAVVSADLDRGESVWVTPRVPTRSDFLQLTEAERRERRENRRSKLLDLLKVWSVAGSDVSLSASFPDGPKLGMFVGEFPPAALSSETFFGRNVVFSMQDKKCAHAQEFRLGSPFHTLNKSLEKRSVKVDIQGFTFVLGHDVQFGFLLQDWLTRMRAAVQISREARMQRKGIPISKVKKPPLPDIHFSATDVKIFFEDHPISSFLTRMLPLMQDEARERERRDELMACRIDQLRKIAKAEIAETPSRCLQSLKEKDSQIWVSRAKQLKMSEAGAPMEIANGFLPPLDNPPVSKLDATSLAFSVTLDDLCRQMGSTESIRRLKMLDDYELGSKKYNKTRQHDPDVWNSIGFRSVAFEATDVVLTLRDYELAFLVIDRWYFDNSTIGQAVQAALPPYMCETTVAIGRRRVVKIVKGLGPTKTFSDIHLIADNLTCGFNPTFIPGIADFGKGVARFFGGGKNPSPRIPWFDSLRVSMHGRMRLTARKFKGIITSSTSPYSTTSHFAELAADNFEMLSSRLEATEEDPFPISWKFYNWTISPSSFEEGRQSSIVFDFVRVGFNPVLTVNSGDPQDHYFAPFPTREEVAAGGPGIGNGTMTLSFVDEPVGSSDNGFGSFTDWYTGMHDIPGFDSFADFKTREMILGIDVYVRHPRAQRYDPENESGAQNVPPYVERIHPKSSTVLFSDAISTMTKVVLILIRRPISCRLPPRRVRLSRKPPSLTGFSSTLHGLDIKVDAKDLNVTLHNNLEPGHSLFISIDSLDGELRKRTEITEKENGDIVRDSAMTRRRFDVLGIYSSIKVPGLDMAMDHDETGKLLTVDKISLSDNVRDELRYMASPRRGGTSPSSGFGMNDRDESPFYTFSANHPLQRGKKLDKVQYDKRLLVDRVRLIWSPVRRASVFAWPDAFKIKSFCMKAPKTDYRKDTPPTPLPPEGYRKSSLAPRAHHETEAKGISMFQEMRDGPARDLDSKDSDIPMLKLTAARTVVNDQVESPKRNASIVMGVSRELANDFKAGSPGSDRETLATRSNGPQSPQFPPLSKSKATVRKHVGSMVDLLANLSTPRLKTKSNVESKGAAEEKGAYGSLEVLKTSPKYALYINDCEVAFGSPQTIGYVFLTSKAVRVGVVDKQVQKSMQLGENNETWTDREYRFHLDGAEVFTRDKDLGVFDFSQKNWVPQNSLERNAMALVTLKPICMDLIYISSSSTPKDDLDEEEDHILRPSLVFINIPDIRLSTNAREFHAITDVVRKVLMQSMRSSEIVNEELASLRYKLQLAGGKVSSEELDDFMRRLNNVTKQFLYAGDTFQRDLVKNLEIPNLGFADSLTRYKAKAKAVATFMRQDQRANRTDVLYPTMYVSYSFDTCSWELREKHKEMNRDIEDPFVEITLEDLVCRHIFYVGRGTSTEMTFANISAQNKMSSYFNRILQPATTGTNYTSGTSNGKVSQIKSSDGAPVAFRWYSTQEDRVGGVPIFELLTVQVAPMTAAVTRKLWSSVSAFIFSSKKDGDEANAGTRNTASFSRTSPGTTSTDSSVSSANAQSRFSNAESSGVAKRGTSNQKELAVVDDVSQMQKRGDSSMLFKYVFIDAFELTASYKNKETSAKSALDFIDLFVTTPSFSYSSQIWTWKDFSNKIKRDLVATFFLRGASNLAKIKLLPGYNRARRRFIQGADSVVESIYNHLPSTSGGGSNNDDAADHPDEVVHDALGDDHSDQSFSDDDDREGAIDAAVADISGAEGMRREHILRKLYGDSVTPHGPDPPKRSRALLLGRPVADVATGTTGTDGSADGHSVRRAIRNAAAAARPGSSRSHGSYDEEEGGGGFFRRRRRRPHEGH